MLGSTECKQKSRFLHKRGRVDQNVGQDRHREVGNRVGQDRKARLGKAWHSRALGVGEAWYRASQA